VPSESTPMAEVNEKTLCEYSSRFGDEVPISESAVWLLIVLVMVTNTICCI
jgi:hypothetical protein